MHLNLKGKINSFLIPLNHKNPLNPWSLLSKYLPTHNNSFLFNKCSKCNNSNSFNNNNTNSSNSNNFSSLLTLATSLSNPIFYQCNLSFNKKTCKINSLTLKIIAIFCLSSYKMNALRSIINLILCKSLDKTKN